MWSSAHINVLFQETDFCEYLKSHNIDLKEFQNVMNSSVVNIIAKATKREVLIEQANANKVKYYKSLSKQEIVKQLNFPQEQQQKIRKIKEAKIQQLLLDNGIKHVHEHTIQYKCVNDMDNAYARVDFVIESHDYKGTFGLIFLEVDEDQHKSYPISCEVSRMSKIIESLKIEGNNIPIKFIRYNPDNYAIDNVQQEISENYRYEILIQTLVSVVFDCPFSVEYLFYDTNADGTLVIFNDPEYNESFKSFVM